MEPMATPAQAALIAAIRAHAWAAVPALAKTCDAGQWTLKGSGLVWLLREAPMDGAWAAVAAVMASAHRLEAPVQLWDRVLVAGYRRGDTHHAGAMMRLAAAHRGPCDVQRGDPAQVRWFGAMASMLAAHGAEVNPALGNGVTAMHVALRKNGTADGVVALVQLALGADPWKTTADDVPPPAAVIHEVAATEAALDAEDYRPRRQVPMATSVRLFGVSRPTIWTFADVVGSCYGGVYQQIRALAAMAGMRTPLVVVGSTVGRCCGRPALVTDGTPRCRRCAAKLPSAAAAAAATMPLRAPVVSFAYTHTTPGTELAVGTAIVRARAARLAIAIGAARCRLPAELWGLIHQHLL